MCQADMCFLQPAAAALPPGLYLSSILDSLAAAGVSQPSILLFLWLSLLLALGAFRCY
jgi:hypothetical protein